jgi:DNA-directed RNA polymerase specialized sigma24 family protein
VTQAVTSEEIAAWRPRVEEIARRFGRSAEFDDLVQEGLISVWVALSKGVHPTDQVIRKRMRMWIRTLRRQTYGRSTRLEDAEDELDEMAVRDEDR